MRALSPLTLQDATSRYRRRVPIDLSAPCRPWSSASSEGYGTVMVDGEVKYVHRLSYQLHVGPIPRGWEIDHLCHSETVRLGQCGGGTECQHRRCWEPGHLEAVSSRENSMRGNHALFAIARRSVCGKGLHDLTKPENVRSGKDGRRRCGPCAREGLANWRRNNK